MGERHLIEGIAASLDSPNLDTDQIMPKQFLRGVDKSGLADGLLWNLRHHPDGSLRPEFVLNRPEYAAVAILVGGPNFGCGSSREHAVWGLQQFGIRAVIAPSFGEIFYSNAMNNGLLAAVLQPEPAALLMARVGGPTPIRLEIDIRDRTVRADGVLCEFALSARHQRMLLEGLDMVGVSLAFSSEIAAFAQRHWSAQPWVRDVALKTAPHAQGEASAGGRALRAGDSA